ncbi:hypothetical protein H257_06455 [Aphanomyces astaci]|uniref:Uncharacterized protein n=1 Tax=Aphanomyces astaci TaxID=112090 RepID=W4GNV2_APHAT|nr:hypothetical protein H257_06455 [Aphanomyces astaci]ETV81021.1 hypothetical protein H257_06455 [Aphanomyces astaci]|eukprot:XP_009829968.1 hypothetical protein H257_06455 [Aphanomyces astaci]
MQSTFVVTPNVRSFTSKLYQARRDDLDRSKVEKVKTNVQYECLGCTPRFVIKLTKASGYQNFAQHVYRYHKDVAASRQGSFDLRWHRQGRLRQPPLRLSQIRKLQNALLSRLNGPQNRVKVSAAYHMSRRDPNDNAHGAREHILFLDNILRVYKRNISNVRFMVYDNCSANKRMAKDINKFVFEQYRPVIHKFQKLMVGLKSLNNRVHLRKLTSLSLVLHNSTCWSSYHAKIVASLLQTPSDDRAITELVSHLNKFESVTVYLQRESLHMVHVRTLFDELIKDCPSMRTHLQ